MSASVLFQAGPAAADPQTTVFVEYTMYEDPNDAESDVVFKVRIRLQKEEQDGDDIGWSIGMILFRQPQEGQSDKLWVIQNPTVPTQDGLWWVTHADPDDPASADFLLSPQLTGTATALQSGADLYFETVVDEWFPPLLPPPHETTGKVTYYFLLEGETLPEEEGEEEPVKVEDVTTG